MSRFARRIQSASGPKGAALFISPASGSFTNGSTVIVTIMENSYSEGVNAIQANLTYPTNRLTFQSISTTNSNFTTTMQSSGGGGSVQIGVGLLGGSLTGAQEVARVTFTANSAGSAPISFAAGSGIARESDATDICKRQTGATYVIT